MLPPFLYKKYNFRPIFQNLSMNPDNPTLAIYSTSDLYPLFAYMHDQVSLSSDRFKQQNEIARTIWLSMRIDGEIKNGGIEQLFSNFGEGFDPGFMIEALTNIRSTRGTEIVQEFIDFIHQTPDHKRSFYGEYAYVKGFDKKLSKLHNTLSDEYYTLDPSVEALIVQYAEANWENPEFQESIRSVVFETGAKDESELIGDLNDALKNGNVSTAKKILKNLTSVNQSCQYGFVPILELPYVSSNAKKTELLQLLLDHGADIHMRDKYHHTVLHKAARAENNSEFIEFLLDSGADIEIKDDYDNTPVFGTGTNPENSSVLIRRGANLHIRNKHGFSPLTKILMDYRGWYGNPHAKKYHPKIRKVMDQFLAAGATFSPGILLHENTELSLFAEDAKLLKHLLKQKSVKNAPEFNAGYNQWSAVFEASMKGNLECLKLLAESGALLNQALDAPHYETKTFIGATPMTVAKNQDVRAYLEARGATAGARKSYSLFLETQGTNEQSVIMLIQEVMQADENESRRLWNTVRKNAGKSYEKIDGEFIRYSPLLLQNTESEAAIKSIESKFRQFDCECTLI